MYLAHLEMRLSGNIEVGESRLLPVLDGEDGLPQISRDAMDGTVPFNILIIPIFTAITSFNRPVISFIQFDCASPPRGIPGWGTYR